MIKVATKANTSSANEGKNMTAAANATKKSSLVNEGSNMKVATVSKGVTDSAKQTKTAKLKNKIPKTSIKTKTNDKKNISMTLEMRVLDGVSNIDKLMDMAKRNAKKWHRATTDGLYEILGQCYYIHYLVETATSTKERTELRTLIERKVDSHNLSDKPVKTETRIVGYVFGQNDVDLDAKTRSRYARVIKKAFDDKENRPTGSEKFVDWIKGKNGITSALKNTNKLAVVEPTQSEMTDMIINCMPSLGNFGVECTGNRMVVMLANGTQSGNVEVLWSSENESLVGLLLKAVHKEVVKKQAEDKQAKQVTASSVADELRAQTENKMMEAA